MDIFDLVRTMHTNNGELEQCLQEGLDPNTTTINGETLLMRAAVCHNTEMMSLLLQWGANIDQNDDDHLCALFYVLKSVNGEKRDPHAAQTAIFLLEHGANPYVHDEFHVPFLLLLPRYFNVADMLRVHSLGIDLANCVQKTNRKSSASASASVSFLHMLASVDKSSEPLLQNLIAVVVDHEHPLDQMNSLGLTPWENAYRHDNHYFMKTLETVCPLKELGCVALYDIAVSKDNWQQHIVSSDFNTVNRLNQILDQRISASEATHINPFVLRSFHEARDVCQQRLLELSLENAVRSALEQSSNTNKKKI